MKETQEILRKMGFKNLYNNIWDSFAFGSFTLEPDMTPKMLALYLYNRDNEVI